MLLVAFVFKLKQAQKSVHLDFFSPPESSSGRNVSSLAEGSLVAAGDRWEQCSGTSAGSHVAGEGGAARGGGDTHGQSKVGASGRTRGKAQHSTTDFHEFLDFQQSCRR